VESGFDASAGATDILDSDGGSGESGERLDVRQSDTDFFCGDSRFFKPSNSDASSLNIEKNR
jgi:hypothetical protein